MDGKFKLVIHDRTDESTVKLFDLSIDPAEEHDLSDAQPTVNARLSARLAEWQQSVLQCLNGSDYEK